MASNTESAVPTNPVASAPNGIGGFFSFIGNIAGQVVQGAVANKMNESNARSTARVQETLNAAHVQNPATGPNDPAAAQNAANRSFLEKFLPESMLYNTSIATTGETTRTPTMVYYAVIAIVLLGSLYIAKRFLRR